MANYSQTYFFSINVPGTNQAGFQSSNFLLLLNFPTHPDNLPFSFHFTVPTEWLLSIFSPLCVRCFLPEDPELGYGQPLHPALSLYSSPCKQVKILEIHLDLILLNTQLPSKYPVFTRALHSKTFISLFISSVPPSLPP